VDVDAAVVRVDDLAHDGQPEAGALGLGGEERIEDAIRELRGHAGPVVGHLHDDRACRRRCVAGLRVLVVAEAARRRDGDVPVPLERLECVHDEIREHLAELVAVAIERRQVGGDLDVHVDLAPASLGLGHRDRIAQDVGNRRALGLEAHGPHVVEHLDHGGVRHLGFVDDVGEDRLRVGASGNLPAEQACHHLDARERILQLVRHGSRHLAERGEPVAQALPFLELFDACQVLEEESDTGRLAHVVPDERQRVADHLPRGLQAQLDAVRQVAQFEAAGEHAHDVGVRAQDVGVGPADVRGVTGEAEDAVRLVVHHRDGAVARDREHAVAHAAHHVPEEAIADDPWCGPVDCRHPAGGPQGRGQRGRRRRPHRCHAHLCADSQRPVQKIPGRSGASCMPLRWASCVPSWGDIGTLGDSVKNP
jgi:hypothetical protein